MSYDFTDTGLQTTLTPDTGGNAEIFYTLKERLKANGWTHVASGDGTANSSATFGNGNDVITHNGTGANGMLNTSAYFILRQPSGGSAPYAGTREILVQMGNNFASDGERNMRMMYSFSQGFSGGSPSPTVPPDFPADVAAVRGGGDAGSPSFLGWDDGTSVRNYNVVVGDVDENFSFMVYTWVPTVTHATAFILFDGLESGSFPYGGGAGAQEPDPYVMNASWTSSASGFGESIFDGTFESWYWKGEAKEMFRTDVEWYGIEAETYPANVWTGKDPQLQLWYARQAAPGQPDGIKGVSHFLRWNGAKRSFHDLMTVSATGDRLCVDDLTIPWNNTVPPV